MQLTPPEQVVPEWDDLVARLRDVARREAAIAAEKVELLATMAAAGDATGDRRSAAAEVAAVLQSRRETVLAHLHRAERLVALRPVLDALRTGRLGWAHALAALDATEDYAPELADRVAAELLETVAPEAVLLPSVLKQHLARRLATADPSVGEEQVRGAAERVEASLRYEKNGLASVVVRMTHLQGFAYWRRVNAGADQLAAGGDDRPVAQRRVSAILRLAGVVMPGCSADDPEAGATGPTWGGGGASSGSGGGPSGAASGGPGGGSTCGSSECIDVPVLDVDLLVPLGLACGPVTLDGLSMTAEQAQDALRHSRHVRVSTIDPETGGVLTVSRPVREPRPPDPPPPGSGRPPHLPDSGRPPDPRAPHGGRPPNASATRSPAVGSDPDEPALHPVAADACGDRVVGLLRAALTLPVRLTSLHTDDYRPTAAGHRYTRTRDVTCTQPACDRPATACDTDHRVAWPLGPTCPCNTESRCRFDHLLKQSGGTVVRLPDGDTVWTTADGIRSYRRPALLDERPTADRPEVDAALARLARRPPLRRRREPGRPVLLPACGPSQAAAPSADSLHLGRGTWDVLVHDQRGGEATTSLLQLAPALPVPIDVDTRCVGHRRVPEPPPF